MRSKKKRGINALKAKYGWICISPWIVGLILFFISPIIQSIIYSFSSVSLGVGGMNIQFVGLKNFRYIFLENADYLDYVAQAFVKFVYSFPVIIILSLILALMLNQEFKGRILFRALYFLPVIIAAGPVLKTVLSAEQSGISNIAQDESIAMSMFNVSEIVDAVGLPQQLGTYFVSIIDGITGLIWNCGIQTVLFIAGMQAIPTLLYEVSKVEGATKWEEFWLITLPMLGRVILLVSVFTMVELMVDPTNPLISLAYSFMKSQFYGESSAMLWSYFVVIGLIMAALLAIFKKTCLDKWE